MLPYDLEHLLYTLFSWTTVFRLLLLLLELCLCTWLGMALAKRCAHHPFLKCLSTIAVWAIAALCLLLFPLRMVEDYASVVLGGECFSDIPDAMQWLVENGWESRLIRTVRAPSREDDIVWNNTRFFAALVLLRKKGGQTSAPAAGAAPGRKAPPANLKTGSYSFISGFQNAATVEMSLDYDADKFSFAVVEEEFLSYSSDSHVALLRGEDFSLQLEYAAYYTGEDFAAHCASLAEKHRSFGPVRYGSVDAVKYLEGDNLCFCIPIPQDEHSYVQAILFKAKENDTPLADLAGDPDLAALLESIRFRRS